MSHQERRRTMAQALATYLEADRVLATVALDDDGRKAWQAIKAAAYSIVFFGD